ncbi:MAG TPA: helix-turn-helix domain-containing protein [Actinomycetota bacterium]|jgi:Sugar-specific transcriptional regulator TrmB
MAAREPRWDDDDEQLVADLVLLGLTRNEARLYLAAEGRPPLRAAELAELAGVTRTKAYAALDQLARRGMVSRQPGRVALFEAADPRLVARQLRQRGVEDQANLVADTGALVADLFARYYAAPASGDPFDFVELIRHGAAAWARREAIAAGAGAEVLLASMPGPAGTLPPVDPTGQREGVSRRSLYALTALDDPGFRARVAEREARGEQVRFARRVAVGLCVVDRRSSVLGLDGDKAGGPGTWLVLEHPGLSATIADAFDAAWAQARPAPA